MRYLILLALLCMAGCSGGGGAHVGMPRMTGRLEVIQSQRADSSPNALVSFTETVSHGNVFALNDTTLITAKHVCEQVQRLRIDGRYIEYEKMGYFGSDGCYIIVKEAPQQLRRLSHTAVAPRGTRIMIPGYVLDEGLPLLKVARGVILGERTTSAMIENGMSGSPVIDAQTNTVMGVACKFYPDLGISELTGFYDLEKALGE